MPFNPSAVLPILLLVGSNVFMTVAWYGHLKFPHAPMWAAVMASWGIALVEYWLAVPANRIGYGTYSAAELKTIQEVISLTVFVGFAVLVLGEKLTWNHAVGFTLIFAGAFFIFKGPLN
ncbi:DMT family protein [Paradevosia shaoguanensis]|uniref:DMT family protein n=1 Tax=Paradevosia shaoguanensis TaxID=1335043 RepID=UPI00193169F4|nr:DMT family protein [Paradevosia shaoguanensis]